ncbi:arylamine N-acetyltransferase [Streptosporangium sp. NPDC000239]|uniref:arylamine N-acetyltransferase family protein n=1 Tax=Streptosporangium sp. NPDC000239 TaxID=3154248 RepID=UPI00332DC1FD
MNQAGRGWDGETLDLAAYLARISFEGDLAPTARTLRALQRAHAAAIPFENLEVVLGRPVLLDLEALQDKMVRGARGGYCYEHTRLFAAALERLGFGVTGLAARVRMGSDRLRAATHALLLVEVPGSPESGWICDVGFGEGPTEPIELVEGAESEQGGRRFRLERSGREWVLNSLRSPADGWLDLHSFTLDPRYPVDYVVINHYISTHPNSPFVNRLVVRRPGPGVLYGLLGTTLTAHRPDGSAEERHLEPGEVPKVLEETFGVRLGPADAAALTARLS